MSPSSCKHKRWLLSIALLGAIGIFSLPVRAADPRFETPSWGRITIMEENDRISSSGDKHYTQGMRASFLSEPVTSTGWWDQPYGWLSAGLPIFDGESRKRKYEWTIIGQSLFTPANIETDTPSIKDRPYAAWLYTGISLLQETNQESHETLENAELQLGVVGAAALGALTQNDFHQFIGVSPALGWKNQIRPRAV